MNASDEAATYREMVARQTDEQIDTWAADLFIDFAKNDADLQVAKFWVSNLEHGKPYFAPPGIPEDRLAILRRAFDATMKDPDFLREIDAASENIDGPMTGEELAQLVNEQASTPPAVVKRISNTIQKFLKEGNC